MYWSQLLVMIALSTAIVILFAIKKWKILYLYFCAFGVIGAPGAFSLCVYESSANNGDWQMPVLILLFSAVMVVSLICARRLFSKPIYRLIFLFCCVYYIIISAGLFGRYYVSTQYEIFEEVIWDIYENIWNDTYINSDVFSYIYRYWCYIRAGLPYFFELPPYGQMTSTYILQFLLGKVVEVAAIGTVAEYFINLITPEYSKKQ